MTAFKDLLDDLSKIHPILGWMGALFILLNVAFSLGLIAWLMLVARSVSAKLDPLLKKVVEKRIEIYWSSSIPSYKADRTRHYAKMAVYPDGYLDTPGLRMVDFKNVLGPSYKNTQALGWTILYYERFICISALVFLLLTYLNLLRNIGVFHLDASYFHRIYENLSTWWYAKPTRFYESVLAGLFSYMALMIFYLRYRVLENHLETVRIAAPVQYPFKAPKWAYDFAYAFHNGILIALPGIYERRLQKGGAHWENTASAPLRLACAVLAFASLFLALGILTYIAGCILGYLHP